MRSIEERTRRPPKRMRVYLACALLAVPSVAVAQSAGDLLQFGARDQNAAELERFFNAGGNPHSRGASQALVRAAGAGQAKALAVLLAQGVRADSDDGDELTPRKALTYAAASGNEEAVALLLRYGADPNTRNDFPRQLLLIHGTSPHRYPDNGKTALMYAAEAGHDGVVRQLIAAGADVDAATVIGVTALMQAASKGNSTMVKTLLDGGARPNAGAGEESPHKAVRGSALFEALAYAVHYQQEGGICSEQLAAANELLRAYERTHTPIAQPHLVLNQAVWCGDPALISRLIALGAVKKGSDALLAAGLNRRDNPEIVRLLVAAGADPNARADKPSNETPLMRAAAWGAPAMALALLDAGADVNAETDYGETALWLAARRKQADMVAFLLSRNADPNRVARPSPMYVGTGGTALGVAVASECLECARHLLAHGADPRIPNAYGEAPLDELRSAGLVR